MKKELSKDSSRDSILETITQFYLKSRDFNGIFINDLEKKLKKNWEDIKGIVQQLIKDDMIGVIDEDTDLNPHIIRLGFENIEKQLEKVSYSKKPRYMCFYPKENHLQMVVDKDNFQNEPYKLQLALGKPQLSYKVFDLSVLEFYRNDPRYRYTNDDIQGRIYCDDDQQMSERDNIILETYGFAYDKEFNRAVAVFLRYLTDLSPEHQQIWLAKELPSEYKLHPDYYRNTIIGDWGEKVPICQAILKEIYILNKMSSAMERPNLFKQDFGEYGEQRPKKFHFLIRPTLGEFNSFILLFDKMISENINKDFFQNEVAYENEEERKDGKIVIRYKGTLRLLDEWIRKYYITDNWDIWDEAISVFKKIRKLRQKPAHAIKEDEFDQKYFKHQREIIIEAYESLR